MNRNQFPALEQFLGGYFHQDFFLDYGNPDVAIEAFLADASVDAVQAVCNELEQVLSEIERIDDPENSLWRVLGCYYLPKVDGLTVANWLRHVHKRLCD